VAGIQATAAGLITDGVHARGLSFERIAHLTATAPAQLFGLYPRKGAIAVGADADFAIVDPEQRWTFSAKDLPDPQRRQRLSRPRIHRRVVRTVLRGKTVCVDGEVVGRPGWGQFVRPQSHISTIMDMSNGHDRASLERRLDELYAIGAEPDGGAYRAAVQRCLGRRGAISLNGG